MIDDTEDTLITLRMQYVEDLEDILQCPVCWELPSGSIFNCQKGHHICEKCYKLEKLHHCPTCQSTYYDSRNYLAESLFSKFEDIKSSILDPSNYINRRIVKTHRKTQTTEIKTICANTQTETDVVIKNSIAIQTDDLNAKNIETDEIEESNCEWFESFSPNESESDESSESINEILAGNSRKQSVIPCLLKICELKCSIKNIVSHIKNNHRDKLIEGDVSKGPCQNNWSIPYVKNKWDSYVINIQDMGLIFLNIVINNEGSMSGNMNIVKNDGEDQQIGYILFIKNSENSLLSDFFCGHVSSYSSNANENNNSGDFYISSQKIANYLLNESTVFKLSLILYK